MNLKSKTLAYLISAAASVLCQQSLALPEDTRQPILVNADSAQIDKKTGVTVYKGNVILHQGTMKILADTVTIYSEEKKINKIIATGDDNQAQYQQQPSHEKQDELVVAKADTIEYMVGNKTLHLLDNAYLLQDGATMKGYRIDYDLRASVAKASGQGPNSKSERIQVVIPAKQLHKTPSK